eukprot:s494_g11.t1
MSRLPEILEVKKAHFGGDHTFTYVRASKSMAWEEAVEVNGMVVKWAFSNHGNLYLSWLEFHDVIHLYRTNFYVGECVMWTCFFNNRPDWGVKLPTLRTLNRSRLTEREVLRQEHFDQVARVEGPESLATKERQNELQIIVEKVLGEYAQVCRRNGYRGSVKGLRETFPVDVTSLPALMVILSVVLSGKGLGNSLLQSAYKILSCLSTAGQFTQTLRLLPNDRKCWIDIVNGEFTRAELKVVLEEIGVPYQRFKRRALGEIGEKVLLGNFVMTMLLLKQEQDRNETFTTVVKRLIHLFCQNVESALIEGGDAVLSPECPDPEVRTRYHPFMRHSRRCGNSSIRQALSKDFLARGGGFTTVRHEMTLKKLGVVGPKSSLGSLASSEFVARQLDMASKWVAAYLAGVASSPYGLKVINFALDESRVAQQQASCRVLPILVKIGAKLFPAPTQMVPETGAGIDGTKVLESLAKALKGCLPNPESKLVTTRETWLHREYRQATRNLLVALGNALVFLLPNGFKMSQCIPSNLLKPRGGHTRVKLLQQEIHLLTMGRECDRAYRFLWSDDSDRICRNPDFYLDPTAFYRLTFSGDEGTDVFLMFQHLTSLGSWICFWPDVPHKFQRKQAMALSSHEVAKMKLKQFMKVFRSNRAPFSTSKFGKQLKEAKQRLLMALQNDPDHELLQMFLPGIARDLGCDPSSFTASQAIRALALRAGSVHVKATECKDVRWGAWLDHAQAWDMCWHCEAMVMLYAMWEAGENPWTGQQQVSVEASDERAYSIKKIRSLDFDPDRAKTDEYWMAVVKSVAGITHEMFGSLLTSVPVEMTFNDLRDACKRFSKQEVTTPVNIHSVIARTCQKRIGGVETLIPENSDWATPLPGKTMKKLVFDSTRCTDVSIGVNTSGLTRKKSEGDLTKPHIFSYRLQLLRVLHGIWLETPDHDNFNAEKAFRKLWKSSLVSTGMVFRFKDGADVFLVLTAGPYCVSCLKVDVHEAEDVMTIFDTSRVNVLELPILDIQKIEVGTTKPVPLEGPRRLGWTLDGVWMNVPSYVAQHGIWSISASLLYALCSDLGLKGHSKLDHKRRAEFFMKHQGCSEEHIADVLASLPEKVTRKRNTEDTEESVL